jgi:hypothetical protein
MVGYISGAWLVFRYMRHEGVLQFEDRLAFIAPEQSTPKTEYAAAAERNAALLGPWPVLLACAPWMAWWSPQRRIAWMPATTTLAPGRRPSCEARPTQSPATALRQHPRSALAATVRWIQPARRGSGGKLCLGPGHSGVKGLARQYHRQCTEGQSSLQCTDPAEPAAGPGLRLALTPITTHGRWQR